MGVHSLASERGTPLVTYWYDREETASEAVIEAFGAANVEVFDASLTLQEQIECDALDGFDWNTGCAKTVSVRLWGHHVVITPETVQIYELPGTEPHTPPEP